MHTSERGCRLRPVTEPAQNDVARQNQMIVEHMPLAAAIAARIHRRLPPGVALDDLKSTAVLGLMEAVQRYDATRAVEFRTFAKHRITGAVLDALRASDWVPRSVRGRVDLVERARARLREEFGRPPTRHEVAGFLQVSIEDLEDIVRRSEVRVVLSLDAPLDDEGRATLGDTVAGDDGDLLCDLEDAELRQATVEAIAALPDRERTAVVLFYVRGLSLKEAGEVMGVSDSRVCQICAQGVRRLRLRLRAFAY